MGAISGSTSAKGAKNAPPFDNDEDGYAIGEGKKHGKGIAALKHRADSLTRLGKKDLDDALDMNKNGMCTKQIEFVCFLCYFYNKKYGGWRLEMGLPVYN